MASWDDLMSFVRVRYEIMRQVDGELWFNLPTTGERTQIVAVRQVTGEDGHPWVEITSPVGKAVDLDLGPAARAGRRGGGRRGDQRRRGGAVPALDPAGRHRAGRLRAPVPAGRDGRRPDGARADRRRRALSGRSAGVPARRGRPVQHARPRGDRHQLGDVGWPSRSSAVSVPGSGGVDSSSTSRAAPPRRPRVRWSTRTCTSPNVASRASRSSPQLGDRPVRHVQREHGARPVRPAGGPAPRAARAAPRPSAAAPAAPSRSPARPPAPASRAATRRAPRRPCPSAAPPGRRWSRG